MRLFELTDLADKAITKLREEGVEVYPADVLALQSLSIEAAGRGDLLKGRPRDCGGVTFWPLTIGAACWYSDVYEDAARAGLEFFAYAYASAHARDRDALKCYGESAMKAVRDWRRGLAVRMEELEDAVLGTMADTIRTASGGADEADEVETIGGFGMDASSLAVSLSALCGGDAEAWLWVIDIDEARRIIQQRIGHEAAANGMPVRGAGVDGMRRFTAYCAEMRARPRGEAKPATAGDGGNG